MLIESSGVDDVRFSCLLVVGNFGRRGPPRLVIYTYRYRLCPFLADKVRLATIATLRRNIHVGVFA